MGTISGKVITRAMCAEAINQLNSTPGDKPEQNLYFNKQMKKFNDEYNAKIE